jgi:hypothetical protein
MSSFRYLTKYQTELRYLTNLENIDGLVFVLLGKDVLHQVFHLRDVKTLEQSHRP